MEVLGEQKEAGDGVGMKSVAVRVSLVHCGAVRRERSYIHRAPPLLRSVTKCPCMWPVVPVETF